MSSATIFVCPLRVKMKWLHFQRTEHCHFHLCHPSYKRSTLKEKNLLLWEQILSVKGRPYFWRDFVIQGSKQEVTKVFLLIEWQKIYLPRQISLQISVSLRSICLLKSKDRKAQVE